MHIFFLLSLFSSLLISYEAPYQNKKFHQVLDHSKLQAPTSTYNPLFGVPYGKFKNVAHKYFYLQKNSLLTFYMCGEKNRSELREKNEWQVQDSNPHILFANVKLDPYTVKKEFTFLQIHANPKKDTLKTKSSNKPLLRLVWRNYYHLKHNHLWAIVYTPNHTSSTYTKIDLGELRNSFQTFKIIVQNSKLQVFVDEKLKVDLNVSYWNGIWNYYKAGVYLQSSGCARAYFKELRF